MSNEEHKENELTVSDKTDGLNKVFEDFTKWVPQYDEFAQGRTNFQIEKFITMEEGLPAHAYVHTLYQTRVMRGELLREVKESIELTRTFEYKWKGKNKEEPIWWETTEGGKKLCWHDTDEMEFKHRVIDMTISMKDKMLQLKLFDDVLEALEEKNGKPFTREQYLMEEPEYWSLRFQRQIMDDYIMAKTGINAGNSKSVRLAMASSPLPDSVNQIKEFPNLIPTLLEGDPAKVASVFNEVTMNLIKGYDSTTLKESGLLEEFKQEIQQLEQLQTPSKPSGNDPLAKYGIQTNNS